MSYMYRSLVETLDILLIDDRFIPVTGFLNL